MKIHGILVSKIVDCELCEVKRKCKSLKKLAGTGSKCPLITVPWRIPREPTEKEVVAAIQAWLKRPCCEFGIFEM
jgi:hypothetical protein